MGREGGVEGALLSPNSSGPLEAEYSMARPDLPKAMEPIFPSHFGKHSL